MASVSQLRFYGPLEQNEPAASANVGGEEPRRWGIPASLAVHSLLVVALLLSPAAPKLTGLPEQGVPVHIMSPQEFRQAVAPAEPAPSPAEPAAALEQPAETQADVPAPASVPEPGQGMVVARTMMSEKTLADPRSRQARRELATFADDERVVQLCNLEAMDQIQAWRSSLHPDRLVAYARSDARLDGDKVSANGAAFRSDGKWFDVKFECEVTADHGRVVAMRFEVGDAVPPKDWDELGLAPVH